jgi:hypothetical protein
MALLLIEIFVTPSTDELHLLFHNFDGTSSNLVAARGF